MLWTLLEVPQSNVSVLTVPEVRYDGDPYRESSFTLDHPKVLGFSVFGHSWAARRGVLYDAQREIITFADFAWGDEGSDGTLGRSLRLDLALLFVSGRSKRRCGDAAFVCTNTTVKVQCSCFGSSDMIPLWNASSSPTSVVTHSGFL